MAWSVCRAIRCLWLGFNAAALVAGSALAAEVHDLARAGNVVKLRELLEAGADPNARDPMGRAPLMGTWSSEAAALLIAHGADANLRDSDGQAALHVAVVKLNAGLVECLLEAGADPNVGDVKGDTPLHLACWKMRWCEPLPGGGNALLESPETQEDIVRLLVSAGADPRRRNKAGRTPAHYASESGLGGVGHVLAAVHREPPVIGAARSGDLAVVRAICAADPAQVNAQDLNERTPLFWAVRQGRLEIARFLLGQGASSDVADYAGTTPLHEAAGAGNLQIAGALLEAGAGTEAVARHGYTPLHRAAANGHERMVNLLLDRGAAIEGQGGTVGTPLLHAAGSGHVGVVAVLLARGASPNADRGSGGTAIHVAAWAGQNAVVELLLARGVPVDAMHALAGTPLMQAASGGRAETVRLLLARRADVKARALHEAMGHTGRRTALHFAAESAGADVMDMLFAAGAEADAKDDLGQTALHVAASRGNLPGVQALLARGASLNARDAEGRTATSLARWLGSEDVYEWLRQHGGVQ